MHISHQDAAGKLFGVCVPTAFGARSSASSCGLRLDDGLAHAAQMPPNGAINVLDPLPQNPSSRGPVASVRREGDMGAARTDCDDEQGPGGRSPMAFPSPHNILPAQPLD